MKYEYCLKLVKTLVAAFLTSFLLISCNSSSKKSSNKDFVLNTSQMQECKLTDFDSIGLSLLAYYPYHINNNILIPPVADVYICQHAKDNTYTEKDIVVILDTHLQNDKISNPEIYELIPTNALKYNSCTVQIPDGLATKIKQYKYMYAKAQLVTDD